MEYSYGCRGIPIECFYCNKRVPRPKLREGIPIKYSYGCPSISIEYSYGTKEMLPSTPQVMDPVENVPLQYSYGCPCIPIEYFYGCPGYKFPKVTDPMESILIKYSYGCHPQVTDPVVFL